MWALRIHHGGIFVGATAVFDSYGRRNGNGETTGSSIPTRVDQAIRANSR
jgi:hypothetical protein